MATNAPGRMPRFGEVFGLSASDEPAFPVNLPRLTSPGSDDDGTVTAAQLLREFESFRSGTYWDENAWRLGYGSDTITDANGNVRRVKKGDTVSREDAERDLQRRIVEFQRDGVIRYVGQEAWARLPSATKAAVTSLAYNYGSLSKLPSLVRAIKSGNAASIADAVAARAGDNGGINKKRRMAEASIIRGRPIPKVNIPDADPPIPKDRTRVASLRDAWASANAPVPKILSPTTKAGMIRAGLPAPKPLQLPGSAPSFAGTFASKLASVPSAPKSPVGSGAPTSLTPFLPPGPRTQPAVGDRAQELRQRQAALRGPIGAGAPISLTPFTRPPAVATGPVRTVQKATPLFGPAVAAPKPSIAETLGGKPPAGLTPLKVPASGPSFADAFGSRIAAVPAKAPVPLPRPAPKLPPIPASVDQMLLARTGVGGAANLGTAPAKPSGMGLSFADKFSNAVAVGAMRNGGGVNRSAGSNRPLTFVPRGVPLAALLGMAPIPATQSARLLAQRRATPQTRHDMTGSLTTRPMTSFERSTFNNAQQEAFARSMQSTIG